MEVYESDSADTSVNIIANDIDFILSQDFFCTPDYITPNCQYIPNNLDCNIQEEIPCPKSPEKQRTVKGKRPRMDSMSNCSHSPDSPCHEQVIELAKDSLEIDDINMERLTETESQKTHRYVSQSAVALRQRVMPPPCVKNVFVRDGSKNDIEPSFRNPSLRFSGYFAPIIGGEDLPRYRHDFHELEQIGSGNFSCVFKAISRLDGIVYAVKKSVRQLTQDMERKKALMEVHALASIGHHDHLVGYHTTWFENDHIYIQLELCDHSISYSRLSKLYTEGEVLDVLYQIANALQFIHGKGMAHLDVKPENIYVKDGVYKLGDFGCATKLDGSIPIDEGDARYMPHEILNDNYDNLDKVDIFSLGVTIYELVRGSTLPESGHVSLKLREGKIPLFPGHSVQFQNLLKVMMDRDPLKRPSAKKLVESPIFDKGKRCGKAKQCC